MKVEFHPESHWKSPCISSTVLRAAGEPCAQSGTSCETQIKLDSWIHQKLWLQVGLAKIQFMPLQELSHSRSMITGTCMNTSLSFYHSVKSIQGRHLVNWNTKLCGGVALKTSWVCNWHICHWCELTSSLGTNGADNASNNGPLNATLSRFWLKHSNYHINPKNMQVGVGGHELNITAQWVTPLNLYCGILTTYK